MTVGENIRKIRQESRLTQKELGTKLGISQQQIAQYENDSRIPKIEAVKKIALALDVDITEIIDDFSNTIHLTEKEEQLLASFRELDSQRQDYILLTMEMLKRIP